MAKTLGWKQAPPNDEDGVAVVLKRLCKGSKHEPGPDSRSMMRGRLIDRGDLTGGTGATLRPPSP